MNRTSSIARLGGIAGSLGLAASMLIGAGSALGTEVSPAPSVLPGSESGCGTVPLDVEIILDRSGSMTSESNAGHTRLYWAQQAADQLVDALEGSGGVGNPDGIHRIGLTSFAGTAASVDVTVASAMTAAQVKSEIDDNASSGNTPLRAGIVAGSGDLAAGARNAVGGDVRRVIILLSDGRPNPDNGTTRPDADDITAYLATADVAYSVAIGEGGSGASQVDLALMQLLDKPSGHYFNVVDASALPSLFEDIFTEINCAAGINVVKTASTLALPNGPGSVTFTYTVTNTGDVDLDTVTVTDDKCAPVTLTSGDTGSDNVLALTETWIYNCTKTVSDSQTNIATAHGCQVGDDGNCAEDTDSVTVNVSGVAAETLSLTLPPTATLDRGGNGSTDSLPVVALVLALLSLGAFMVTPRLARKR